jgi:hypothetical protein
MVKMSYKHPRSKVIEMRINGYLELVDRMAEDGFSPREIADYITNDTEIDPPFTVSQCTIRKYIRYKKGIPPGTREETRSDEMIYSLPKTGSFRKPRS